MAPRNQFNNENRIGTYKMTNRFEENNAIYFTKDECDYLKNLVEKDMEANGCEDYSICDLILLRRNSNEPLPTSYEGCRNLKHYVWNVLETGYNDR